MAITNNLTRLLKAKKVTFKAHEIPNETFSALDAAAHLWVDPARMFKTIVATRPDGGKPILAMVLAATQVNLKSLSRHLGATKVVAASQAKAEQLTGLEKGGISPLALIQKGFDIFIDQSAWNYMEIYISGGQRGLNLSLAPDDLQRITCAKVLYISED